jgi:acetyltransferase-like isoleucine patch superfamily enzyme
MWQLIRYDWPLHFLLRLTNWLPDNVIFIKLRGMLARPFFRKCGTNLGIGRNVTFYNPSAIEIGSSVYIAYGCWFLGAGRLVIEDEVLFGPYVVISPANHTKINGSFRYGDSELGENTSWKRLLDWCLYNITYKNNKCRKFICSNFCNNLSN